MSYTPDLLLQSFVIARHAKLGVSAHPLGPLVSCDRAKHPIRARMSALVAILITGSLLAVAGSVTPDPVGLGSHRQLGFGPCPMVSWTGYPCPTCGMTTAFAYTVRGHLVSAFQAQPFGFLLASATVLTAVLATGTLLTASVWTINWYRVLPERLALLAVVLVLAAWGYKLAMGLWSGKLPMG